jgi:hypothetical protein
LMKQEEHLWPLLVSLSPFPCTCVWRVGPKQ